MSEMVILARDFNIDRDANTEISIYTTDISHSGSVNGINDGGDGATSQTLGFDTTNHNHNHSDHAHLPNHTIPVDLLTRLMTLERNQHALKDEVGELKTLLEESKESERVLERRIEEIVWAFNTEQLRMPARLHNATCNKSPHLIKPPPISPGTVPKNFPSTRGEFEHLTRERYEGILNEYGVKNSGDVSDKRETLRAFLGIPVDMVKK